MSTNIESKSNIETNLDPESYKELLSEVNSNLFDFKNAIQLEVIKRLSEDDEVKEKVKGKASELHSTASDFDTLIYTMVDKHSPRMREKIYSFLLSDVLNSNEPKDLLKLNKENIVDMVDDNKKEELINNLTNEFRVSIIAKEEPSIAA